MIIKNIKFLNIFGFIIIFSIIQSVSAFEEKPTNITEQDSLNYYLSTKGVYLDMFYTGEYLALPSEAGTNNIFSENLNLTFYFDTEQAGLWNGGTLFLYYLSNLNGGSEDSENNFTLQASTNLKFIDSKRIFELWYEHSFNNQLSLLFGFHDFSSEFAITTHGGLFLNSSFAFQPEIYLNNKISTFPTTSLAIRLKLVYNHLTFLAGVYDGDPGFLEENSGFKVRIDTKDEGLMSIFEINFKWGSENKTPFSSLDGIFKTGFWYHSGKFENIFETNEQEFKEIYSENSGYYFILDQRIYRESQNQGLNFFIKYGRAAKDRNEIDEYIGAGLNYTGLIPFREKDTFGIAFGKTHISNKVMAFEIANNGIKLTEEIITEFTYNMHVNPWISLQPDIQFLNNPGGDSTIDLSTTYTLRLNIFF